MRATARPKLSLPEKIARLDRLRRRLRAELAMRWSLVSQAHYENDEALARRRMARAKRLDRWITKLARIQADLAAARVREFAQAE